MLTGSALAPVLVFDDFRVDARRRILIRESTEETVPLPTRAFDTLLYLVTNAGAVVPKAQLLREAWRGIVVEENSLSQCISSLRRALGERPGEHRFIVTESG